MLRAKVCYPSQAGYGLDLLLHDPGQLVPGDQQSLASGLLPQPLQDPAADQHARKLPPHLAAPPRRGCPTSPVASRVHYEPCA
jgi:hypothetical protein